MGVYCLSVMTQNNNTVMAEENNNTETIEVDEAETIVTVGDGRGDIQKGLIRDREENVYYATRRTDCMQIVDDTTQPPTTEKPAWQIKFEITQQAKVVNVRHRQKVEDEWFSEANMKEMWNEDGLNEIRYGHAQERGTIESIEVSNNQLKIEIYDPHEIGLSKLTIEN